MTFSESEVEAVISSMGLGQDREKIERWGSHLNQLIRWNTTYNLTAITHPSDVLTHHLADSLSIVPYIRAKSAVDVGTGGGFPGIPLAIQFPEIEFVLVDAVLKKVRFLRQVVAELGLKNVRVHHARVEKIALDSLPDQIISRAFSSISTFLDLTDGIAGPRTEWLAMKGKDPRNELEALNRDLTYTSHPLEVPGLHAERHLVQISRRHDD